MIAVRDPKDCTGCYACYSICPVQSISMSEDCEGFWYPSVNTETCIRCGLCMRVCPLIEKESIENDPKAFACVNRNERIRLNSSSGGVFSAVAEKIIQEGGIVFGAAFDEKMQVVHQEVDGTEDLPKCCGSKYVQSRIGDTYVRIKELLENERRVLFSGTPCQVEGLKAYLRKAYINLLCVDIICHGVPSPKVFQKYLEYREEAAGSTVKDVAFRRKDRGWKTFRCSLNSKTKQFIRKRFKMIFS